MAPRIRNPETRLVSEFMLATFPEGGYRLRVPLGPPIGGLDGEMDPLLAARISRPWRPEVDAIAFPDSKLVLVEAKIMKLIDGLAKLPLYKSLVATTPELQPFRSRPVEMWLVTPWTSPSVNTMATAAGCEVRVFRPGWIADYVRDQHDYHTKEHREARDELAQNRKALGVE